MKPELDDLMTTAGIARYLGVSRQRAHQIVAERRDFPKPLGKLGHYWIWWRPEVEAWTEENRRPA